MSRTRSASPRSSVSSARSAVMPSTSGSRWRSGWGGGRSRSGSPARGRMPPGRAPEAGCRARPARAAPLADQRRTPGRVRRRPQRSGRPCPASGCRVGQRGQERGRQVVDDEPAEILEALRGRAAAGAGKAGDDRELYGGRRWRRTSSGRARGCAHADSTSPVAGSTAGPAGLAASAATMASAVRGPMPDTSVISSTVAARSRFSEPKRGQQRLAPGLPQPGHAVEQRSRPSTWTASAGDR